MSESEVAKRDVGIMNEVNKDLGFKEGGIMSMSTCIIPDIEWLSSGSYKLNVALSGSPTKGYPVGRIIEMYGPESSGKTTLAMMAIIESQKAYPDKCCCYIDAEHSLDIKYYEKMGLKMDGFFIHQPACGEDALACVERIIKTGRFSVVVIDSVSALVPRSELEGDVGDKQIGGLARLMAQGLRMITGVANEHKCTVIYINQLRDKIGGFNPNPMIPQKITTGGNALKFSASQRIDIKKGEFIKDGDSFIGQNMKITVQKNKVYMPFQKAEANLFFGKGFDVMDEVVSLAIKHDIIKKSGAWYSYRDTRLGQGFENSMTLINDNPELFEAIRAEVFSSVLNI